MSGACTIPDEQLCGCCAGITQETPQLINNRPALSSIAYRTGTYATFYASMLASLSDPSFPALGALSTRDTSDFSIALLDSWAVVLDILTFYQERFANEAFLRTALDQRSVFELARLVGYVPSRGVSASAVLAFSLSDAPGSPDNVLIPAGTRVQSIPGPGQTPQVFETSADINATIDGNSIPAVTTIPFKLFGNDQSTWIKGTANNINVGDALLFISANAGVPKPNGPADVRYVTSVTPNTTSGNTQISWDTPLDFGSGSTAQQVAIYIFRKKAAMYGVQAPSPLVLTGNNVASIPGYPTSISSGTDWSFLYADYSNQIYLDNSYPGLTPQAGGPPQWLILTGLGYTSFFQIQSAVDANPGYYSLTSKVTQLNLSLGKILTGDGSLSLNEVLWEFVQETRYITAYVQSAQLTPADLPITTWSATGSTLDDGVITPVEGTSISITGGQDISSNQPIGVVGKRIRLRLSPTTGALFTPQGSSGSLAGSPNQIFLVDAYPPSSAISGERIWSVVTLSNLSGTLAVPAAESVTLVKADKVDPQVSEASVVGTVSVAGDVTALGLQSPLTRIYDAATTTVNANSVQSTNGETVQEILGSGDATASALQFTLKQQPLTYTSAATTAGSQSSLQVWLNNLQWHEVANLLVAAPADRVFVTRVNQNGFISVQFGNGMQGSRTPTGVSNVRAVYRKGIGSAGMVAAGQLSQPLDRPQGLRSVTNPSAASGAADPASADDARKNAPLPSLTIGRVVSLEDYQNFALAFPGISKALASWTWFGARRGVFLSVSGENGATLQTDDPIVKHLILSLHSNGNPYVPIQVASYVPIFFQFTAQLRIDQTNYDSNLVLAEVWSNLSSFFAFNSRQLGQNVAASEIIDILQQTPGVIAVQLQSLQQSGAPGPIAVPPFLCAAGPIPPAGAQMLLLDPATQGNLSMWS